MNGEDLLITVFCCLIMTDVFHFCFANELAKLVSINKNFAVVIEKLTRWGEVIDLVSTIDLEVPGYCLCPFALVLLLQFMLTELFPSHVRDLAKLINSALFVSES